MQGGWSLFISKLLTNTLEMRRRDGFICIPRACMKLMSQKKKKTIEPSRWKNCRHLKESNQPAKAKTQKPSSSHLPQIEASNGHLSSMFSSSPSTIPSSHQISCRFHQSPICTKTPPPQIKTLQNAPFYGPPRLCISLPSIFFRSP